MALRLALFALLVAAQTPCDEPIEGTMQGHGYVSYRVFLQQCKVTDACGAAPKNSTCPS